MPLTTVFISALIFFVTCNASQKPSDVPQSFPLPNGTLLQESDIRKTSVGQLDKKLLFYANLTNGDHISAEDRSTQSIAKYIIRYTQQSNHKVYELLASCQQVQSTVVYTNKYPNFGCQGLKPSSATTEAEQKREFENAQAQFKILESIYAQKRNTETVPQAPAVASCSWCSVS